MKRWARRWSLAVLWLAVSSGPAWASGWSALPIANPPGALRATLSAERWTGGAWRIQATPNPGGAQDTYLRGVSCPTGRACSAVGYSLANVAGGATLAEGWRFGAWTIQPTLNPQPGTGAVDNTLFAVSCANRRACTAVGNSASPSAPLLAERFDGVAGQLQPIAETASVPLLAGVSCPTVRVCIAVGGSGFRTIGAPLAERWSP